MNKEFIGFLAAFLTVISLFPQVIKVYKTKRTTDLSLGRYSMIFAGTSLWSFYFWGNNWMACVNELICAVLYSYILYMKLTETKRKLQKI